MERILLNLQKIKERLADQSFALSSLINLGKHLLSLCSGTREIKHLQIRNKTKLVNHFNFGQPKQNKMNIFLILVTKTKTKSEQNQPKQKQNHQFCYDFAKFCVVFGELG